MVMHFNQPQIWPLKQLKLKYHTLYEALTMKLWKYPQTSDFKLEALFATYIYQGSISKSMQVKVLYQWHRMEKQTFSSQRGEKSYNLKPFPGGYCSTIQISVSEGRIHLQCPRIHIKATLGQHLYHWQNNYQIFWWTILMNKINRITYILGTIRKGSTSYFFSKDN